MYFYAIFLKMSSEKCVPYATYGMHHIIFEGCFWLFSIMFDGLQSQSRTPTYSGHKAEMQSSWLGQSGATLAQTATLVGPRAVWTWLRAWCWHKRRLF